MPIKTKDIAHWSASKEDRKARMKGKKKAEADHLQDQTFEELNGAEKDELLKCVAIKLGCIKPSE